MSVVAVWTSGDIVPLTKASGVTIRITRAVYVEVAGTLNFVTAAGQTITNMSVQAGTLPFKIKELSDSGTATGIWGLY